MNSPFGTVAVLEFYSRKQRRVCRSTFAAELRSVLDGFEIAKLIQYACEEVMCGQLGAAELLRREEGNKTWLVPLEIALDAKSVFEAG